MKQKTKNVNESAVSKDKLVSFVKALHLCPAEKPETRSFRLQTSQLPPSSATHKMVIQIQEWRHSNVLWQKHTQTTISNSSRKHFNSKNRFKNNATRECLCGLFSLKNSSEKILNFTKQSLLLNLLLLLHNCLWWVHDFFWRTQNCF